MPLVLTNNNLVILRELMVAVAIWIIIGAAWAATLFWFIREVILNGVWRDGFFNFRLLWGLKAWTAFGFAVMILFQFSP